MTQPPPQPQVPQGWYPNADGKQQWWDGTKWGVVKKDSNGLATAGLIVSIVGFLICLIPYGLIVGGIVALAGIAVSVTGLALKRPRGVGIAGAIVGVVGLALGIVITAAAATAPHVATASNSDSQSQSSGAVTATPSAPSGPTLTVAQQQAVLAAQGYLRIGGFSYQGLIDQLDSPSGNGFSVADATAAVDSLNADYNAQAVLAAQSYMKIGGFSHASLVEQLSSASGNKFTPAQAEYAATQVGL